MTIQFSVESIEYLAEKLSDCRYLCDESLVYLTLQISATISNLLQDACKVLRKCRRNDLTTEDFAFALKLNHLEPMYGGYTTSSIERLLFHKIKKDNRILYHITDNIVQFDELIIPQSKIPLDISIRIHWLAVNGKQPEINENPIIDIPIRSTVLKKKLNKTSHIISKEQQIYYKELTEMCICSNEQKRKQALLILSADNSLQQILSRLILFISEGVRVNLAPTSTFDRSIILKYLMQMSDALLQNEELYLERYLHYLLPAILSCLLERRISRDHWSLRDLAAKCCKQIIRFE
ncbi:unnamed protein product [Adineta steineri]|uniref:Histone H4 n=1 Tax=Adineta steineri TaxID=433720 RepID=A0A814USU2_9BILA|nr:unnamed protein product [Adineta steineri]